MGTRIFLSVAALLIWPSVSAVAHADTITYTLSGDFTGSLNGVAFNNALGTITLVANPANVVAGGPPPLTLNVGTPGEDTAAIAGFSTAFFAQTTLNAVLVPGAGEAGFYDTLSDFTVGIQNSALDSYILGTALSPTAGTFVGSGIAETTSLGALVITGGSGVDLSATIQHTPPPTVPEPSSFALLGTGLLSSAWMLRRRFARI
jgi:hypothetical protein